MTVALDRIFGCELVTSKLDADGYAYHGKSRAHIVAWEAVHGKVPDGLELDHLCRRRNCRALHHLEPVTRVENDRRRAWSYRVKRKKCPRGHDLRTQRAVTDQGGITCRACNQAAISAAGATR